VIHGLVKQPMVYTLDALSRYPTVTRMAFLECSGNSAPITAYARAREGVTRNVGLQTIKAAIEKAVMQRGSYPLARQSMGLSVMLPPVNRML
jgi:hypothetical protein